jgi:hypothetical protein
MRSKVNVRPRSSTCELCPSATPSSPGASVRSILPDSNIPFIDDDGPAYRKLLDRTCFRGHEYDVSTNYEVKYPKDVAKKKGDLLRRFNPLLENGDKHQQHFIEEEAEGGSTAAPPA